MTYDQNLSWEENVRLAAKSKVTFPRISVVSDTPEYVSPVTGRPVDGRAARREDLKRAGCVEAEPPARKKEYRNARYKLGATLAKKAKG